MTSLYDQEPENWEKLRAKGRTALAEMAKHFDVANDMDRALGTVNCVRNWMQGKIANISAERLAEIWLKQNGDNPPPQQRMALDFEPAASPAIIEPQPEPDQTTLAQESKLMIITGKPEALAKVKRVLAMIDCEVEPV